MTQKINVGAIVRFNNRTAGVSSLYAQYLFVIGTRNDFFIEINEYTYPMRIAYIVTDIFSIG